MKRGRLALRAAGAALVVSFAGLMGAARAGSNYVPLLWLGAGHSLLRVSATDGALLDRIDTGHHKVEALATDRVTGTVWMLRHHDLQAYDRTGQQLHDISLDHHVHADAHHAALAVDHAGGVLWLVGHDRLYRFGLDGDALGTVRPRKEPEALALDRGGSILWTVGHGTATAYGTNGQVEKTFSLRSSDGDRKHGRHGWHGHVEGLAYSPSLQSLWVLGHHQLYRYETADGTLAAKVSLPHHDAELVAADGSGAVWVAGHHGLARIDGSGAVDLALSHIPGLRGHFVALAADPADQSVWAVSEHALVHVGSGGAVLQTVSLDEHHHEHGRHHGHDHIGPVRAAALWADTTPPALSVIAPAKAAYVATTTPPLVFHYRDEGSGADLASLGLAANGTDVGVSCPPAPGTVPSAGTATCALADPLSQGGQSLSATVEDYAGNESEAATRSFTVDTIPPTITVTQPDGQYTNQPHLKLKGSLSEAGTLTLDGTALDLDTDFSFNHALDLTEGDNALTLVATDLAGNSTTKNIAVTLDTVPPDQPNFALIAIGEPKDGVATVTGQPGAVEPGVAVTVTDVTTGAQVTAYADQRGGFTATLPAAHGDLIRVTLTDEAGNVTHGNEDLGVGSLPPRPADVAPVLTPTGVTPFGASMAFLYSGSHPIQTGVSSGTIKPKRAAVLRGRVLDANGNPLPGVVVSILGHPDLGKTQTRLNGKFDIAVNGGGSLTVVYNRKKYTEVERTVRVGWNAYAWAPDVVLRRIAPAAGTIRFGPGVHDQFITGPMTHGAAGSRQVSIYLPADTSLTATLADGSTQRLSGGRLHMTEYTVGPNGPKAMPITLPPYTQYTYATGMRLDEKLPSGTQSVKLSHPLYAYLNDFLNAPVGTVIPSGQGDLEHGRWQASTNGLVIELLGVNSRGEAELDLDGKGQPAGPTELANYHFNSAELKVLANHFPAGAKVWRMPMPALGVVRSGPTPALPKDAHTSAAMTDATPISKFAALVRWVYDWNPTGFMHMAPAIKNTAHKRSPKCDKDTNPCCTVPGCIVGAMDQTLGERIPVTGLAATLDYGSGVTQMGSRGGRTLVIPMTGKYDPARYTGFVGIRLEVDVAGEHFVKHFPAEPNETYVYVWNGLDGYGRPVTGSAKATVTIGFETSMKYVWVHKDKPWCCITSWAMPFWTSMTTTSGTVSATRNGMVSTVSRTLPAFTLHGTPLVGAVAHGWNLSSHAQYDPSSGTLYEGDGSKRSVRSMPLRTRKLAANLAPGAPLAVAPDGNVATLAGEAVVDVSHNGSETTLAKMPSTAAVADLRYGPSGYLFALDGEHGKIYAILRGLTPWTVVRGLKRPRAFVTEPGGGFLVAACGAIYSAQQGAPPARIAGQGCSAEGDSGDGAEARDSKINPTAIGLTSDKDVIFVQHDEVNGAIVDRVREIAADGTLSTIAGGGDTSAGTIEAPTPATSVTFGQIKGLMVRPDGGMLIATGAGLYFDDAGTLAPPKTSGSSSGFTHVRLAPSGAYFLTTHGGSLWRLSPALPVGPAGKYTIASRDGGTLDAFDSYGREKAVYDTITGAKLRTFQYDSQGRLVGLTDPYGRTATIRRGVGGHAQAIVSPDGQTTALAVDGEDNLTAVSDPAGDTWKMAYGSGALLSRFTNPDGRTEHYAWDRRGRLTAVSEPNGGGWSISLSPPDGSLNASADKYSTILKSGEGRTSIYTRQDPQRIYRSGIGSFFRRHTTIRNADGSRVRSVGGTTWKWQDSRVIHYKYVVKHLPDGTVTRKAEFPSARFGAESPLTSLSVKTPSGLTRTVKQSRAVTTEPGNLVVADSFTDTVRDNGRTYTNHYDATSHSWLTTSPAGRTVGIAVDALDRPTVVTRPGVASVGYSYDDAGRLTSVAVGSGKTARIAQLQYYDAGPSRGWLRSVTDPLGRTTNYSYDAAGHVTTQTLPDGEEIGFGYDAAGNLTSVTPPERPAHALGYTSVDQLASYAPPTASAAMGGKVRYDYNRDRQLTEISLPSGKGVSLQYNDGGQLASMQLPGSRYHYRYDAKSGHLTNVAGGSDNESLGFHYDGFLPTKSVWSGPVPGTIETDYNGDFVPTALQVDGNAVAYRYTADKLLRKAGRLSIRRNATNGQVTGTRLANIASARVPDGFGETKTAAVDYVGPPEYQYSASVDHTTVDVASMKLAATVSGPGYELDIVVSSSDGTGAREYFAKSDSSGHVTRTLWLNKGENRLSISLDDPSGKRVWSTQRTVDYEPSTSGKIRFYSDSMADGVTPGGDFYGRFGKYTCDRGGCAGQGNSFGVLPAGASTPINPAWLANVNTYQNLVSVAPDGSVYYIAVNAATGDQELWRHAGGQATRIVDLAKTQARSANALAVTPDGTALIASRNVLYTVGSTGALSLLGTVPNCSGAVSISAQPASTTSPSPTLSSPGGEAWLQSSPYGVAAGCRYSSTTPYRVNDDGSFTQLHLPAGATFGAFGPNGAVCYVNGDVAIVTCAHPDGSRSQYSAPSGSIEHSDGPMSVTFDPAGHLYAIVLRKLTYPGNYVYYADNIYRWSDGKATPLINYDVPSSVAAHFKLTQTDVTPGRAYQARYTYDKDGEITAKAETVNGHATAWSYGYDKNGRLTSVTRGGATTTYGYDANGNRITVNGSRVATYNARDQLLTYANNTYTWNADGELAAKTTASGTTHYTWNALGELTDVALPDGTVIHYVYDGMGRRVGKEKNGTLVAGYLYAGGRVVAKTDASGEVTERFVYGTKPNVPSYMIKYNADGTSARYRIVSDQVGSMTEVIDATSGAVVQRIVYDVWGNIESDSRPGFQPFAFAGGLYDADTKLDHFGARDYDPATGRWISRDPIFFAGGDANLYRYVVDNPVSGFDSLGLRGSFAQMARGIAGMPLNPSDLAARQAKQKANSDLCRMLAFKYSFERRQFPGVIGGFQRNFGPVRAVVEGEVAAEAAKEGGVFAAEKIGAQMADRNPGNRVLKIGEDGLSRGAALFDVLSEAAFALNAASTYAALLDPVQPLTGKEQGCGCH